MHVLTANDRALAERGRRDPPTDPRDPFDGLEVAESPCAPVLGGRRPRRHAALAGSAPAGYAELVQGTIVQIELNDLEDPLAYLHGPYRSVQELDDRP